MKNLKKFISWIGTKKEFKGLNEGQIVEALNEMASSKEGKDAVAKLMAEFKQDQKIESASEVLKAQEGAALRKAKRAKYREVMDGYKDDPKSQMYRRSYLRKKAAEEAAKVTVPAQNVAKYDRDKAKQIMIAKGVLEKQTRTNWDGSVDTRTVRGNAGDNRVLAKKAKSAAVDGFNADMYNWDPNQTFDRERFRERKQIAKTINPEWSWRQRRAFALMDAPAERKVELPEIPVEREIELKTFKGLPNNLGVWKTRIDTNIDWDKLAGEVPEIQPVPISKTPATPVEVAPTPVQPFPTFEPFPKYPTSQTETPNDAPITPGQRIDDSALRNHPNFRNSYTGDTFWSINGTRYPIAVTTGLLGNGSSMFGGQLQNDETYAYDPNTGKIRRVQEDIFGRVKGPAQFAAGSEWINMPEVPTTVKRDPRATGGRALHRTVAGSAW